MTSDNRTEICRGGESRRGDYRRPRRQAEAGNERFGGFVRVQVGGDEAELRDWLGEGFERMPVEVVAGEPGLRAVAIGSPGGEVVLSD